MVVDEIRVLVGVEENPHLQRYKEPMKKAEIIYHLIDSDPKRTPLAFVFNGEPEPSKVFGLSKIEEVIQSILDNP